MCTDVQDKLLEPERQKASTKARLEALHCSKGLKHVEAGVASPSEYVGCGVVAVAPIFIR